MIEFLQGQADLRVVGVPFLVQGVIVDAQTKVRGPGESWPASWSEDQYYDETDTEVSGAHAAGSKTLVLDSFGSPPTRLKIARYVSAGDVPGDAFFAVDVAAIRSAPSAAYVLAGELLEDVLDDAQAVGWAVGLAVTPTNTANVGEGLAAFKITVEVAPGVSFDYQWTQPFRVERRRTAYTLTGDLLAQLMPRLAAIAPTTDKGLDKTVEAAWRWVLRPRLEKVGIDVSRIVAWEPLEGAHASACLWHVLRQRAEVDPLSAEAAKMNFEEDLDQALEGRPFWYDAAGAEGPAERDDDAPGRPSFMPGDRSLR